MSTIPNPFDQFQKSHRTDATEFLREHPEVRSKLVPPEPNPVPTQGGDEENSGSNWPDPPAAQAFYGLAGEAVQTILPHTESSAVALLIQTLIFFGNVIGRTAYFEAEASRHFGNLFAVLVGVTSVARKGSSWAQVLRVFRRVDAEWADSQIHSGLSSGEGLIWAVRDPITKHEPIREKGRVVEYQDVEVDAGITDKRALVFEGEFGLPLTNMARDGNTLSVSIRQAWDTGDLRTMTKNSPARATDAHVSVVGHITRDELLRKLNSTEMANGFANRILWACTTRSKELPEEEETSRTRTLTRLQLGSKKQWRSLRQVGEIKRDDAIRNSWKETYHQLTAGTPGLLGHITSRAVPQTMRLACLYALLDHSRIVRAEHLLAAVALVEYCHASTRFIFGDALGDPTADAILRGLRDASKGLDRTSGSSASFAARVRFRNFEGIVRIARTRSC